ncbi:hypothetical protein NL492_26650, partial [Klebsiella pneumoniae]|nr:hypothetical protein [Klebsiella pneumoniae]
LPLNPTKAQDAKATQQSIETNQVEQSAPIQADLAVAPAATPVAAENVKPSESVPAIENKAAEEPIKAAQSEPVKSAEDAVPAASEVS